MQQLDADAIYALPAQPIVDWGSSYLRIRPYLAAFAMAIAGAALVYSAGPIVGQIVPLAQRFDAAGDIAKPDLLLRPVYSLGIFLVTVAALKAALMLLCGLTLRDAILDGTRARTTVAISVFFVGALSCLFLYALTNAGFYGRYFAEDGALEDLTAVVYFAALVLYSVALVRYAARPDCLWPIAFLMLFCAAFSLFVALEEISYGQRIFGWHTPEVLAANVQQESNLHNLLTYSELEFLEWMAVCGLFLTLCALVCVKKISPRPWLKYAPADSLLPLSAAVMILSSHGSSQEVMENSAALFALLYSVQLLIRTAAGNGSKKFIA